MNMKKIFFILFIGLSTVSFTWAQNINHQNHAWFMLLNSTKFNDKWGLHFDAQIRTADDRDDVRSTLIRPGLTYYFNNKSNATIGYLWSTTQNKNDLGQNNIGHEHRIWEQFILNHKLGKSATLSHRFRLEQRFIDKADAKDVFAQRFRYFFRVVQPFKAPKDSFKEGMFVALQNELFFNVQNKVNTNGHFFDQNRAYLAMGYRVSPKFDIEAGYMNQYAQGAQSNSVHHIAQLALYTRF